MSKEDLVWKLENIRVLVTVLHEFIQIDSILIQEIFFELWNNFERVWRT